MEDKNNTRLFWFLVRLLIVAPFGTGGLFFRWATTVKSGQTVIYVRTDSNELRIYQTVVSRHDSCRVLLG